MTSKPLVQTSAVDEATPLLTASGAGPTAPSNEDQLAVNTSNSNDDDDTPLPKTQIFLLCYARLAEPIAFFSIFPFINQMIYDTGYVEETHVGFYSGLIESLFSLTQMLLMISWGRAADHFGRKPVLVLSLAGASICTALFGLSTTVWQMVFFRCLGGAFTGTVLTVRAMISENSTSKTQARAFSFFSFTGNLGLFLGPLISGTLANPATQYPSIFGNVQLFKDFPYALSTFATGSIGASAAILSALFVNETLHHKTSNSSSAEAPMSTREIIQTPGVARVLYIYGHVGVLAFAYTAVVPIFWFTDPSRGGFGFTPLQISIFLAGAGVSQSLWTLIAFPPLQRTFGTGGVLRACAWAWPISFTLCPICNLFLKQEGHGWNTAFWILAPTGVFMGSGVSMAFTAVQLALNDISPSSSTLGTVNAIALTLSSGLRAIAPALFASLFAVGAGTQLLYGYFIWVIMVALAAGLTVGIYWLPAKAEGRLKSVGDEEER